MKRILLLLLFSLPVQAQTWSGILAPARAIDWTGAGVAGGIPTNYTQCVNSQCATVTGGTVTTTSLNAALANAPDSTYVLVPAGTFTIASGVLITRNNVILRGSGPQSTTLTFTGHDSCGGLQGAICVRASDTNGTDTPPNSAAITAGTAQGSTQITLGANLTGATVPFVGASLTIDRLNDGTTHAGDNGTIYVCSTAVQCTQSNGGNGRSGRNQQQIVKISSIVGGTCASGCTVNITPGLYMPNWGTGSPQATWIGTANTNHVGIENITLDFSSDGGGQVGGNGIQMFNVQDSWVTNTILIAKQTEPVTAGCTYRRIEGYKAHNITVRNNYMTGRKCFDDYGVDFWNGADSLIENNIFQRVPTPMMCENCYGNVYGYNFSPVSYWGNPGGSWMQGSVYHHGSFDSHVLAEGNVGFSTELENYFGQAFFYTIFRNRWAGYQPPANSQRSPGLFYALDRYENVVGNVLGVSGYHTQYLDQATGSTTSTGNCELSIYAIGLGDNCANGDGVSKPLNDTVALGTHMFWGNYDTVNAANRFVAGENGSSAPSYPALANPSQTLPASFYYSSKPTWWPTGKAWPPIGPDVTSGNIGVCTGGTYAGWPATSAGQCTGGSLASAGLNTEATSNPAMDCYFTLGGLPDGSGGTLAFDASTCYIAALSNASTALSNTTFHGTKIR